MWGPGTQWDGIAVPKPDSFSHPGAILPGWLHPHPGLYVTKEMRSALEQSSIPVCRKSHTLLRSSAASAGRSLLSHMGHVTLKSKGMDSAHGLALLSSTTVDPSILWEGLNWYHLERAEALLRRQEYKCWVFRRHRWPPWLETTETLSQHSCLASLQLVTQEDQHLLTGLSRDAELAKKC